METDQKPSVQRNAFDLCQAARLAYIENHVALSRAELLHLCRVGGISAGRIKHNYHLANMLWEHFGLPAYRANASAVERRARDGDHAGCNVSCSTEPRAR
jgi:hypothetical protein